MSLEALAKALLLGGAALLALGGVLLLAARLGVTRLPGDIVWRGDRTTIYVPLGLSILASIVLTIVLNLILRR